MEPETRLRRQIIRKSVKAVKILSGIMSDENAPVNARIAAAKALMTTAVSYSRKDNSLGGFDVSEVEDDI